MYIFYDSVNNNNNNKHIKNHGFVVFVSKVLTFV